MSKKATAVELEKKIAELTEALQRERADALNLRRRAEDEKRQLANYYKAAILRDLLPAIDNLERALKHAPKELAEHDYVKGVQGVAKQFDDSLTQLGIERIKSVGEKFDPHYHEAVHMEHGDGAVEVVCEELQPGYRVGDQVIRHAIVKVRTEKRHAK